MWIEIVTKELKALIPLEDIKKVELSPDPHAKTATLYIYTTTSHDNSFWGHLKDVEEAYKTIRNILAEGRKDGFISIFIDSPNPNDDSIPF